MAGTNAIGPILSVSRRRLRGSTIVVAAAVLAAACVNVASRRDGEPDADAGAPFRLDGSPDALRGDAESTETGPRFQCSSFDGLRLELPSRGARWRSGWEQVSPAPFRGTTKSVAGTSASDVWWSGQITTFMPATVTALAHYDGTRTIGLLGVGVTTWPIGVVSANEVWLGPHLRWVGGSLERSPSSAPGDAAMKFFGSNDGWSVGDGVWRWNGAAWVAQTTLGTSRYTAIDGTSASDVWVAGAVGLRHWNGATWENGPALPTGAVVRDVRVLGPTDIWAVGSGVFHYDGAAWSTRSSAIGSWLRVLSDGARTYFLAAGGIGIDRGNGIFLDDTNAAPCARTIATTGACTDAFMPLTGELFVGTNPGLAGGAAPPIGPWLRPAGDESSAGTTSITRTLGGPGGPSAAAVFRATTDDDILAFEAGKLYRGRFDGSWVELDVPRLVPGDVVERLSGFSSRELWISLRSGASYYALRYDGTRFGAPEVLPVGFTPNEGPYSFGAGSGGWSVRGSDGSDATAISNGVDWTIGPPNVLVLSPSDRLRLVSGASLPDVVVRWRGGVWATEPVKPPPGERSFKSILATGANDVVVLGERGSITRWDGSAWTQVGAPLPVTGPLMSRGIYLGDGRVWVDILPGAVRSGVAERGCVHMDSSVEVNGKVSGNADRIFYYDNTSLRTRTFAF